jgi:hypothetical protein
VEELIFLRTDELVVQWELADPRDRWRHTGELPPAPAATPPPAKPSDRPAKSTISAFWYLVQLNEPDRLEAWLADHPKDAPFLYELLQVRKNEKR